MQISNQVTIKTPVKTPKGLTPAGRERQRIKNNRVYD